MIRCPFNNFSKCDGSCPFSTQDFAACKLASLLIAIEGQSRGQLAQIATANAHLVEVKDKLDALAASRETEEATEDTGTKRAKRASRPDLPRLRIGNVKTGELNAVLVLPRQLGAAATAAFGERVGYTITGNCEVLLYAGKDRKLSTRDSAYDDGTVTVAIGAEAARLAEMYPDTRVIYLELVSSDGVFRLKPTGEVE